MNGKAATACSRLQVSANGNGDITTETAYSYIRFSSKKQEEGDSIRRQVEVTTEWAERRGVHLDTSLRHDRHISAFRGKNRDLGSLAEFLRLVETGRVQAGSYLVVEALDRLTREEIQPALLLVLNLLQKGIRVVQLKPVETIYDSKSDSTPIILMIVELSRGHSESAVKSDRVGKAWAQRRKHARAKQKVLTRKLPAWIKEEGGWLVLVPERAKAVQRIFELCSAGYGLHATIGQLKQEGIKPFGPSGRWSIAYVHNLLTDRRALGEFQPKRRGGLADGEPIEDYFPPVVTEAQWQRARLQSKARFQRRGRIGGVANVFQGLLKGARDGYSYSVASCQSVKNPYPVLRSTATRFGEGSTASFPFHVFERAILAKLAELDPREIINGDQPDDTLVLSNELALVEGKMGEIEAEMLTGDIPALTRVLRTLEEQRRGLAEKLATARREAAHPLSEAWGETSALLKALDDAPDPREARLRLRAALRRIVENIWLLVVRRGLARICAVQIWFAGGKQYRNYLIYSRPAHGGGGAKRTEASWEVRSFADVAKSGAFDLRKPKDAALLEKRLATFQLPPTQ
jgi:DNA invertase Pin-like site-specific DNA recombinase